MAITTLDDVVNANANSRQLFSILKAITAPKSVGAFQSAWLAAGRPGAGSAPPLFSAGSGYTCDRTTPGALGQVNGSAQLWTSQLSVGMSLPGMLMIYDRLWSCSGMGFAASTYTVTSPGSLPARITDSGVGVEAFVEQFVAAGAASGTLTLNYLNTAGAAKAGVISAVVSAPVAGQLQPIPWQTGDVGISQVTSVVTSATWTSGSFGITLAKLIAMVPIPTAGVGVIYDWSSLLDKIPADACLMFAICASSTTAPNLFGKALIIDK